MGWVIGKRKENKLSKTEADLFNRFAKAILFLSSNPKHPGLKTHEIAPLSEKYGFNIWQSYLEQGVTARRFYWAYGPNKAEITILGIEPHPENKKNGSYKRIKLSSIPKK